MSEQGKRVVLELVHKHKPEAVAKFGLPSQGRHPLVIQLQGESVMLEFDEDRLADLAHNGGVKAGIEMHLRIALEDLQKRLKQKK